MFENVRFSRLIVGLLAALICVVSSCDDPTELGADLIPPQEVFYSDTFSLKGTTELDDSVLVYDLLTARLTTMLCGDVVDPVFGNYSAEFYTQFFPESFIWAFRDIEIDSVVLSLAYDLSTDVYGPSTEEHSVAVHLLDEALDNGRSYYASDTVTVVPDPMGELMNFVPDTALILEILEPVGSVIDTSMFAPHLRIPLDTTFWGTLMRDSLNFEDDTVFLQAFPGIAVLPTAKSGGLMHFNMLSTFSRITVYYTQDDTVKNHFKFNLFDQVNVRFTHFDNRDYVGSTVEPFIGQPGLGDSLLFIQSMDGLSAKIEIPHIQALQNRIINHAEIRFFTIALPQDDVVVFDEIPTLAISTKEDGENQLRWIDDLAIAAGLGNLSRFGGNLVDTLMHNGMEVKGYKMNISDHIQDMAFGDAPTSIYIETFAITNRGDRVVICGPNHPTYPIELKITYSSN